MNLFKFDGAAHMRTCARFKLYLSFFAVLLLAWSQAGLAAEVSSMRTWAAPDNTRFVFDLSSKMDFKMFRMPDRQRVVVDLSDARLATPVTIPVGTDRIVNRIRMAQRSARDWRMVFDLNHQVDAKAFLLAPSKPYGHRLVIDFIDRDASRRVPTVVPLVDRQTDQRYRKIVVAIDAGHGGEDPGARSTSGIQEKDIVLAVAQKLATLVDAEPGMKSTMIRDGDYYVGLRDRIRIARERNADLFISIHADAFRDSHANGSSVYMLSRSGASDEAARWLAKQENSADLAGGVSLDDKDDYLKVALLDIAQVGVMDASSRVGRRVLESLSKINDVHHGDVQRAGFVVLKAPDIPSILVETAFLTNRADELRLRSPQHQHALAAAIMEGIRSYFNESAPPGTMLAQRRER